MSDNYPTPKIGVVVIVTLLGLAGSICYFLQFRVGFYLFSSICLFLLLYNVAKHMMKPETWPILASCAAVAAFITGNWLDSVLLGVSFYYAISWIVVLIRAWVPDIILLFFIGLAGISGSALWLRNFMFDGLVGFCHEREVKHCILSYLGMCIGYRSISRIGDNGNQRPTS